MANWSCSVSNVVMCRKRLSSPRCRSELIDSAWVVIVPGQKKEIKGGLVDHLFNLGIGISYDRVLSITKNIYESIRESFFPNVLKRNFSRY